MTPQDAVIVANYINQYGTGPLPLPPGEGWSEGPFVDVNGDNQVGADDFQGVLDNQSPSPNPPAPDGQSGIGTGDGGLLWSGEGGLEGGGNGCPPPGVGAPCIDVGDGGLGGGLGLGDGGLGGGMGLGDSGLDGGGIGGGLGDGGIGDGGGDWCDPVDAEPCTDIGGGGLGGGLGLGDGGLGGGLGLGGGDGGLGDGGSGDGGSGDGGSGDGGLGDGGLGDGGCDNIHQNDPPVAAPDMYSARKNQSLSVLAPSVLSNDTDPDCDSLTASLVTPPIHGTVSLSSNGSFVYQPTNDYVGSDSYT